MKQTRKRTLHRLTALLLASALLTLSFGAFPSAAAAAAAQTCNTKYPILLVHGAGFRDMKLINYWGRIPAALEENGAQVFYGNQDGWGTVEANAETLKARVNEILAETGAKKVNIIAHSKGGIDARYMISSLNMGSKVASLTTISSPHHGSKTVDIYASRTAIFRKLVAGIVNLNFRILGDDAPDFYESVTSLTTEYMVEFNQANPNVKGVYYQSYAGAMKTIMSDIIMAPPHMIVSLFDGRENDGMVSVESATWGNFRGVISTPTNRGISHLDEVDFRRSNFTTQTSEGTTSDIRVFYVNLVSELKTMGY